MLRLRLRLRLRLGCVEVEVEVEVECQNLQNDNILLNTSPNFKKTDGTKGGLGSTKY